MGLAQSVWQKYEIQSCRPPMEHNGTSMGRVKEVPGGVILARVLGAWNPLDPTNGNDLLASFLNSSEVDVVGQICW
jgi:hypothetical protein